MVEKRIKGATVIVLSFVVATFLMVVPLPDWIVHWRPVWIAMVLIYWCMTIPKRVGIAAGWVVGLLFDVLQGTVLGLNALSLTILAYLTLLHYKRVRRFSLVQQSILVFFAMLLYEFILLWFTDSAGISKVQWIYWSPAFTSMLLWPVLFIILRDIRLKYIS